MATFQHSIVPARGWEPLLAEIEPGTILVLGARGVGKSVFSRYLVGQLDRNPGRIALLDTDVDQTTIGVPTCLGLALTSPWRAPIASWFVGDVNAENCPLPIVVGAGQLSRRARDLGAHTVIIDTPGIEDRAQDRERLHHLALACGVDQVVAIAAGRELDWALALSAAQGAKILRLKPSPVATARSSIDRVRYRQRRLRAHFSRRDGKRAFGTDEADVTRRRFGPERFIAANWSTGFAHSPKAGRIVGMLDAGGYCLGLGYLRAVGVDSVLIDSPTVDDNRLATIQGGRLHLAPIDLGLDEDRERAEDAPVERGTERAAAHLHLG